MKTPKYKIGDKVWRLNGKAEEVTISGVNIYEWENYSHIQTTEVEYFLNFEKSTFGYQYPYREDHLFSSKEELLNSL